MSFLRSTGQNFGNLCSRLCESARTLGYSILGGFTCDDVQKHVFRVGETSPINSRKHDIGLYLWMRLDRNSELDAMGGVLEAGILRIIPEGTYVFP